MEESYTHLVGSEGKESRKSFKRHLPCMCTVRWPITQRNNFIVTGLRSPPPFYKKEGKLTKLKSPERKQLVLICFHRKRTGSDSLSH